MSIQNRGSSVPLNGQRSSLFIPKATEDEIRAMICHLPNRQDFILDRDLAALCEMTTGQINECAERNKNYFVGKHYFPEDLRFEITRKECTQLLSDYPRLSPTNGNKKISFDTGASFIFKDVPWCYTVYGAKVLAEVINTPLARERMKMVTHVFIKHEFIDKCPAGEEDDESSSDHDYKGSPLTPKELEGKIRSMICRLPNRPPFILDCDLADIYGVTIRRINRQVKRHKDLFCDDWRFQLGRKECSQLLENYPHFSLTDEWKGDADSHPVFKKLPWAYTLYGVKALGAVLHAPLVKERIEYIVRAFEFYDLAGEEYIKDQDDYELKIRRRLINPYQLTGEEPGKDQDEEERIENSKKLVVLPKSDNGNGKIYTQENFSPFLFEELHLAESIQINEVPHFTRKAIGTLLEYKDPQKAIDKIISRNEYIQQYATTVKLGVVEGDRQIRRDMKVYDPVGLQLIINKSTQPLAIKFQEAAAHLVYAYYTGRLTPKSEEKPKSEIPEELIEKIDQMIALTAQKKAPEPAPKPFSFSNIPEEFVERAERLVALAREASQDSNINAILYNLGFTAYPSHETFSMSAEAVTTSSISRSAMNEIPISVKSSAPVLAKTTPIPVKKAQKEDLAPKKNYMASILDSHEAGRKLGVSGQKVIYWDTQGRFDGYKQCTPPFKITVRMLKKWARTERLDDLTELKSEITITEAAKFFAASRTFIREAIYNNILDAKKNDSGQYLINTESLINLM